MRDHTVSIHVVVEIYAFADDIALAALDISHLTSLMPIIDTFSSMSGLGINQDKTKFISSTPFTDYHRDQITNCVWDIKHQDALVKSHPYLGIIMGPDIYNHSRYIYARF